MKIAILVAKVVTLFFWGAVLINLFSVFPAQVETILGWAGAIILFAHFIEVIIFTSRLGGRLARPGMNKLMVLVFGLFYVLPFMREAS